MAAIVRLSRFTGGWSVWRRFSCPMVYREFSSHLGVKEVACASFSVRNRADLTVRRWNTSVASVVTDATSEKPVRSAQVPQTLPGTPLDQQLSKLDEQARRWGRVDKEEVKTLLSLVSEAGNVTTKQSIMVLRCTGSLLVKESFAERNAIFEETCKVLKSVGAEINVQVYNAMLRTKLENRQFFSPVEVLSELETEKNLLPNRVTYQLLLAEFCEKGDVEGASTILQHLKSQNLPVNEQIFNALVKGHVKKGDFAGAKAVMTSMSDSGLEPTADTYKTLLCGLAANGDMAGIKQHLGEAESNSVKLFPQHLFEVVGTLAEAGNSEGFDELLSHIQRNMSRYNQDALNCSFRLVAEGRDDMALKVFNCMDRSGFEGRQSLGTVLLRVMIIKGRPIEKVLEVRKQLQNDNLLSGNLEEIANLALRYQHSGYALKVLEKMQEEGYDVKQHYFWPVLKDASASRDIKGMQEAVAGLVKCTKDKDEIIAGSIYRWAVKDFLLKGESLETIVSGLKNSGVSDSEIEIIRVSALISSGKFEEVAKQIRAGTKFSPGILKAELEHGFVQSKQDVAGLVKVLQAASHQMAVPLNDVYSGVLLAILKKRNLTKEVVTNLIDEFAKVDLKLFRNFDEPIRRELKRLAVARDTYQKFESLLSNPTEQEPIPVEKLNNASVAEVESWLLDAKGLRRGNTLGLELRLLSKYCRAGMIEKVEDLKKKMDARGVTYGPDLLRQLGTLAAKERGNLEEALAIKQQLEAQHPNFNAYASLVLNIAKLQLDAKKFEDALETLKTYSSQHLNKLQESGLSDGYYLSDSCINLLRACSEQEDPSKTHQLCDALFEYGYIKKGTFSMISEVMNAYIKKGDPDSTLRALEDFILKLNKAPKSGDIFRMFIEKEDADRLQKAVDLVSTVHGEMDVLLQLIVCFIECNKFKQANKIVETPRLKARMKPLIDGCERFLTLDKEKELQQLVEVTKKLPRIDRDEMLLQLIRLYAKRKDSKKVLEVFSLYEEEGVRPRPRTLRYVAKVLQTEGVAVPFEVPSAEEAVQEPPKPVSSDIEIEAQQALEAKDIAKVMAIKEKLDAEGEEISEKFAVGLAQFLLTRREYEMFRRFSHKLAESGDTNSLLAIRKLQLAKTLSVFVQQRLFLAYLQRNKIEELLDYLKEKPEEVTNYVTTRAITSLNEKRPELVPDLISLIKSYSEKTENIQPLAYIYNFYMLNGKAEEVNGLFQKFPTLKDKVRVAYVCQTARRQQMEDVLHKVIELHRCDNPRRLIGPFNQLLLLKCDQGATAPVLDCFRSALDAGLTFDDFWVRSLQTVASLVEGSGQSLPWEPGMLEKRLANKDASRQKDLASSSDSTSSDSEADDGPKTPAKA